MGYTKQGDGQSRAMKKGISLIFVALFLCCTFSGCATARSRENDALAAAKPSEHPWLDTVIGSPNASEKQFDALPWWQQISACMSAMFLRVVYESAAYNSERESR